LWILTNINPCSLPCRLNVTIVIIIIGPQYQNAFLYFWFA
jgi:hypothetical protein